MDMNNINDADPFAGILDEISTPASAVALKAGGGYSATINRSNPSCLIFVVDQSSSMDESFSGAKMKGEAVADTVNKAIYSLVTRCTSADGCRAYFDIGVIGYGGDAATNALAGPLGTVQLQSITEFERHPLRVEDRTLKISDGAGGIVETKTKVPVWLEPRMSGGTPMCAAMRKVRDLVADWCNNHPKSYPPTIIHITDGQSTDGNPEGLANEIRELCTNDGNALIFNLHIDSGGASPIMFPTEVASVPDKHGRMLFRMSSVIPERLRPIAQERGYGVELGSRFFGFNGDLVSLVQFIQIGSVAAQMR